ncbi:hypothetical protein Rs2_40142 [Raphanus sativus]|nr:hypothetical protein Rs2_40142 [Raphanus sativus]
MRIHASHEPRFDRHRFFHRRRPQPTTTICRNQPDSATTHETTESIHRIRRDLIHTFTISNHRSVFIYLTSSLVSFIETRDLNQESKPPPEDEQPEPTNSSPLLPPGSSNKILRSHRRTKARR